MVDERRLAAHEGNDPIEVVGHRCAEDDRDAELLEPPGEPRGVRVLDVARDELVADRQDDRVHHWSIRELEPKRDVDAVVALSLETDPYQVTSAAAWLHRRATVPPRAEQRLWIAERDGRAAGYAFCFRNFFSAGSTMAVGSVTVASSHRRQGIGSALHERLADHAVQLGATSVAAGFIENDAGVAFAAGLGYREAKGEYESVLDPRAVDASPPVDLDLRTIGDAEAHAAYEIDIAASADVPLLEPFDNVPYDEWRAHVLDHPLYTEEGSFIALRRRIACSRLAPARQHRERSCGEPLHRHAPRVSGPRSRARGEARLDPLGGRERDHDAGDAERRAEWTNARAEQAARLRTCGTARRVDQGSGNGFRASAASTCDVTQTGVVTYFAE